MQGIQVQVWEMIKIYGLLEKLSKVDPTRLSEVREYLENMLRQSVVVRHEFHFVGSDGSKTHCKLEEPHAPHVVSYYETVRYGLLEIFCLGKEGIIEVNGKKYKLNIVVTNYSQGSPETPARADGFYYFESQGGES